MNKAYDDDIPIGSASFKKYDNECAEVKRVFIKQEYRGKGISITLMELLENAARKQGYHYLILESGEPLVAAMALYRKIGYKVIPNYGQYKDMPDSICMRKELKNLSEREYFRANLPRTVTTEYQPSTGIITRQEIRNQKWFPAFLSRFMCYRDLHSKKLHREKILSSNLFMVQPRPETILSLLP